MRLLFPVLALPLLVPAATSAQTPAPAIQPPNESVPVPAGTNHCRKASSYRAELGSVWRGENPPPRRLTELPPAESYKSVYRTVNGCEEPMTVAEYQRGVLR
jgi:hypothetical protein